MSILSSFLKSEFKGSKSKFQDSSADIAHEFSNFLCDVEELFKSSSALSADELAKAKEQLNHRIKSARATMGEASGNIFQQAYRTAAKTNQYAHQQPWKVLGAGVALSFFVGYILARRE